MGQLIAYNITLALISPTNLGIKHTFLKKVLNRNDIYVKCIHVLFCFVFLKTLRYLRVDQVALATITLKVLDVNY